ncbi:MAG: hypothetical protein FWF23_01715 [Alphaproteobacteria bacterium]|nr:hypothetical protein [Alphaproteobacteria bacterium]MCL2505725.1 hypothetical protein [Alphaproteobacteria bacterium]
MFYDKQQKYVSNLPVIILASAVSLFFMYQICVQLSDARRLDAAIAEHARVIQNAEKYREVTSSILKDVLALSESGNKNAKLVILSLKQEGLNFHTSAPKADAKKSDVAPTPEATEN